MVGTKKQLHIGIVTPPKSKAATTPLSNLVKIFSGLSDKLYIITAGDVQILKGRDYKEVYIFKTKYKFHSNVIIKLINHLFILLRYWINMFKLNEIVDVWVFFLNGEYLLLPLLIAKLSRKKVLLIMTASILRSSQIRKDGLVKIYIFLRPFIYKLANIITVYSNNLVKEWQLEKYKDKVLIAHEHFLNFFIFRIKKQVSRRNDIIGYIGRLSEEKGILNFLQAIATVLKRKGSVTFLIGGDGPLSGKIKEYITQRKLNNKIKLIDWIPHVKLPLYLNELKLLVLPSFTEGLPNILLEAMACGTPVLATSVGAIPDIINDGETGFLLKSNDPEHIAERIIEILNKPHLLEKVSINAQKYVKENFNYKKTLKIWQKIINDPLLQH